MPAQMIQIGASAQRGDLPDQPFRTREASSADFGGQIGTALAGAGAAMQNAAKIYQADMVQRQDFDRSKALIDAQGELTTDLTERQKTAQPGAVGFSKEYTEAVKARLAAIPAPTDPTLKAEWDAKVAGVQRTFQIQGYRTELELSRSHQQNGIREGLAPLGNGIVKNPDQADSYLKQGEDLINKAGSLNAAEREAAIIQWREQARTAQALGKIERDPAAAAAALGGTTPYYGVLRQRESGGDDRAMARTSSATGKYQFIDSTWNGVANSPEGKAAGLKPIPEGGARGPNDPRLDATQQDVAIKIFTRKNMEAIQAAGFTADSRNTYLAHFLGAGGAVKFLKALAANPTGDAAAAFPEAASANPTLFYGKGGEGGASGRSGRSLGEAYAAITKGFANTGTPDAPQGGFDNLPFTQQAALRDRAEREAGQRMTQSNAMADTQSAQWWNNFQVSLHDGTAGRSDIASARVSGQLTDFNQIAQAERIVAAKESANFYSTAFQQKSSTGSEWNPFDPEQRKMVDAGVAARAQVNGGNVPQAAFEVWQQTGILANDGARALRQSMNSTDAARAVAGHQIAANMLLSNPNAFAGVEGGSEIAKAAASFQTEIETRGRTAEEAAREIARRNAPDFKASGKVKDDELKKFEDGIVKKDLSGDIRSVFSPGWFSRNPDLPIGAAERGAVMADYVDAAKEHYQEFGDAAAAKKYASTEVSRLYGASNGHIMKYPPERAYPVVNGGHAYVYDQAAAAVKEATGREVKPADVILRPIPGATVEAWRNSKAPRYELWYQWTDPQGQKQLDVVLGSGSLKSRPFYADPITAAQAATVEREKQFRAARTPEARALPGSPVPDPFDITKPAGPRLIEPPTPPRI